MSERPSDSTLTRESKGSPMRRHPPTIAAFALTLALCSTLSGCVVGEPAATSSPLPISATSTSAPSVSLPPTAAPQPNAEDLQSEAVASLAEENGQTACDVLALKPTTDTNELVDLILSTYGIDGMDIETQRALVGEFMRESVAAYCPEQSERINADLKSD
jgi:hypothetical protein